jgi:hypothetical protein
MKNLAILLLFSSTSAFAGGLPAFPGPTSKVECRGGEVEALQRGDSLVIRLDPRSEVVGSLARSGLIVRGFAHDAGFLTSELLVSTQRLTIDFENPQRLVAKARGETTKILNNGDYSLAASSILPNGQATGLRLELSGSSTEALKLQVVRNVSELSRCLKKENDGFFNRCVEKEILVPSSEVVEAEAVVNLGVCTASIID